MTTIKTDDLSIVRTEHPHAARLRDGFAAFARGDLDTVRATMAEDCVWTNAGTSVIAGSWTGWAEIEAMFVKLFEATDGTFSMQVLSVLADDERAVCIYDATSTVAGQTRTMRFALVEEFDADGLACQTNVLAYDQAAADAHMAGIPQQP